MGIQTKKSSKILPNKVGGCSENVLKEKFVFINNYT